MRRLFITLYLLINILNDFFKLVGFVPQLGLGVVFRVPFRGFRGVCKNQ